MKAKLTLITTEMTGNTDEFVNTLNENLESLNEFGEKREVAILGELNKLRRDINTKFQAVDMKMVAMEKKFDEEFKEIKDTLKEIIKRLPPPPPDRALLDEIR